MSKIIYIGGRLESKEKGNVVAGANAILDDTKGKKQNVINKETDDELLRLEQSKQDNLTFDNAPTEDSTNPVTSGGVYTAEKALSDAIEAILLLIPSAATALNKLVDTNTMNSSISTATATFRGTYNAVSDLGLTYQATHAQIEAALDALGLTADNNDYAFVQVPVSDQSQDIAKTERYKNNGTNWQYEYDLNTSGFTAAQWAAINSTITLALVQKLAALPTNAELLQDLGLKQDVLTFDNAPTTDSNNPVKSGGIKTAIDTAVGDEAAARENADTALIGLIGDEKTRAEGAEGGLDTRLGAVEDSVSTIQGVIPSEATSSNKLVDYSSMTTYIGTIIDNMDVTFNVQSTDGRVTLHVTQEDGIIASVQVTTSDIASAADLTLLAGRVTSAEGNITSLTTRMGTAESNITSLGGRMTTAEGNITSLGGRMTTAEGNITSLGGRVSTNETDIANLQQLYNNLQQSKPVPVTALPSTGQQQGVIYRLAGTTSYSDYMWNGSTWVLMATYNNAIDDVPTAGSDNLVKSGGVFQIKLHPTTLDQINLVDTTDSYTEMVTDDHKMYHAVYAVNPDQSGEFVQDSAWRLIKLSVTQGDILYISAKTSADYVSIVNVFDNNGNRLTRSTHSYSGEEWNNKEYEVTTSGASYVIINSLASYGLVVKKITEISDIIEDLRGYDENNTADINEIKDELKHNYAYNYNADLSVSRTLRGYYDAGAGYNANEYHYTRGYQVSKGDKIRITGVVVGVASYPMFIFTVGDYTANGYALLYVTNDNLGKEIDFYYTAPQDGYINCWDFDNPNHYYNVYKGTRDGYLSEKNAEDIRNLKDSVDTLILGESETATPILNDNMWHRGVILNTDKTTIVDSSHWRITRISAVKGDVFYITAYTSADYVSIIHELDSNGAVLSSSSHAGAEEWIDHKYIVSNNACASIYVQCLDGKKKYVKKSVATNENATNTSLNLADFERTSNISIKGKNVAVLGDSIMYFMHSNEIPTNTVFFKSEGGTSYNYDELTNIKGHLYVTSSLVDSQVTENSIEVFIENSSQAAFDAMSWGRLKDSIGAKNVYNLGCGGGVYADSGISTSHPIPSGEYGTATIPNEVRWLVRRYLENDIEAPDCILICCGTNDATSEDQFENFDEIMALSWEILNSDDGYIYRNTFYGGMRWSLETLYRNFKYATIFIATPAQTNKFATSRTYDRLKEVSDAIKKMGERYSCQICNTLTEIGVVDQFENTGNGYWLSDGLHPNDEGKVLWSNYYSKKLVNNYFKKF